MHQFTPIKDYPGYAICPCGIVQGTRNKPLSQHISKWGYPYVHLRGNYKTVHRLVAQTFIPNPKMKPQVNHKDGNKKNNRLSNLEWSTRSENQLHAFALGLQGSPKGNIAGKTKAVHSKYHNVGYESSRQKWTARVSIQGQPRKTYRFDTELEAAIKVNEIITENNLNRPMNKIPEPTAIEYALVF